MKNPKARKNPHSILFTAGMSDLVIGRRLIQAMLSEESLKILKLDTFSQVDRTFVDSELRESYSDAFFRVDLNADQAGESRYAYVYCLFEHKSWPDKYTSFQLLRYMVHAWEQMLRNSEPLCPIIPFVVYQGIGEWKSYRGFEDLVPYPEPLAKYSVRFDFPILDIWRTAEPRIDGSVLPPWWLLLKYGPHDQLRERMPILIESILALGDSKRIEEFISLFWNYVMSTNKTISRKELLEAALDLSSYQFEPGSVADKLWKEGRVEGRVEGREEGILSGQIILLQQLLGEPVSELEHLEGKPLQYLQDLVKTLRARMQR